MSGESFFPGSMSVPANYEIVVDGRISGQWSTRLEGMQITESKKIDGSFRTTLVGRLEDQAALSGILNTLYELHNPVISVTCLGRQN